jgi:hypothetical protein
MGCANDIREARGLTRIYFFPREDRIMKRLLSLYQKYSPQGKSRSSRPGQGIPSATRAIIGSLVDREKLARKYSPCKVRKEKAGFVVRL